MKKREKSFIGREDRAANDCATAEGKKDEELVA
jgi:hypothetical protein